MQTNVQVETLIEKIKHLRSERIGEVIDFVDFINQRDERGLVQAATKMSEQSFEKVWNNEEDDVYNQL